MIVALKCYMVNQGTKVAGCIQTMEYGMEYGSLVPRLPRLQGERQSGDFNHSIPYSMVCIHPKVANLFSIIFYHFY